MQIQTTCSKCGGKGRSQPACQTCAGEGSVAERRSVTVHVPAGVDSSHVLKVRGQGDAGRRGGQRGDIRVRLNIQPHPVFRRDGIDVTIDCVISASTAMLGGTVNVPTLAGSASLKVNAGTQPGERVVMRGKGIKQITSETRGHQYVVFVVRIPQQLTNKQKQLIQQFQQEEKQTDSNNNTNTNTTTSTSDSSSSTTSSISDSSKSSSPKSSSEGDSQTSRSSGFFSSLFGGSGSGSSSQSPSSEGEADAESKSKQRNRG